MFHTLAILMAVLAVPAYCQTVTKAKVPITVAATTVTVNGTKQPQGFAAMHRCVDSSVVSASIKCAQLSVDNRLESVGKRLNQSKEMPAQQTGAGTKFCYASCIMKELKAINPSGNIIPVALEPVITKSSLDEAKKAAALTNLRNCLASNGTMTGCPRRTTAKNSSNSTVAATTTVPTTMKPTMATPAADPICVSNQVGYSCIRAALSNAGCGPKCYTVSRATTMPPWKEIL